MYFIERKVIGPDEKLIGISSVHWIYAAKGLFWFAFLSLGSFWFSRKVLNWLAPYYTAEGLGGIASTMNAFFWICSGIGLIIVTLYCIMLISTEVGLTTKRIIYKTGLLFVDVKEADLEDIKGAHVNHGMLGRLLNYGSIFLDARFIANTNLPAIGKPYRMLKAMNDMRSKAKQDSMTVVLDDVERAKHVRIKESRDPGKGQHKQSVPDLDDPRYQPEQEAQTPKKELVLSIEETREALRRHMERDRAYDYAHRYDEDDFLVEGKPRKRKILQANLKENFVDIVSVRRKSQNSIRIS